MVLANTQVPNRGWQPAEDPRNLGCPSESSWDSAKGCKRIAAGALNSELGKQNPDDWNTQNYGQPPRWGWQEEGLLLIAWGHIPAIEHSPGPKAELLPEGRGMIITNGTAHDKGVATWHSASIPSHCGVPIPIHWSLKETFQSPLQGSYHRFGPFIENGGGDFKEFPRVCRYIILYFV
uniref:Uncharacterized protein n=1 Tax=Sphaerodactylus townsendi TaxID=933632 RepID=A0ACB8GDX0_9SAUR